MGIEYETVGKDVFGFHIRCGVDSFLFSGKPVYMRSQSQSPDIVGQRIVRIQRYGGVIVHDAVRIAQMIHVECDADLLLFSRFRPDISRGMYFLFGGIVVFGRGPAVFVFHAIFPRDYASVRNIEILFEA